MNSKRTIVQNKNGFTNYTYTEHTILLVCIFMIIHNGITDSFTKVIFIPLYVNNQIPINEPV